LRYKKLIKIYAKFLRVFFEELGGSKKILLSCVSQKRGNKDLLLGGLHLLGCSLLRGSLLGNGLFLWSSLLKVK
jgi:hypothetical protein